MKTKASISFIRNPSSVIYANVAVNGTYVTFSTRYSIDKDEFQNGYVYPKSKRAKRVQKQLEDMSAVVYDLKIEPFHTAKIIKEIIRGTYVEGMGEFTIMGAVRYGLDSSKLSVADSTYKLHEKFVERLRVWVKEDLGYADVAASGIKSAITNQFRDYLLAEGCKPTYVGLIFSTLSGFYNDYVMDHDGQFEYFPNNPFKISLRKMNKSIRTVRLDGKRAIYENTLSDEEVKILEDYEFIGSKKFIRNWWRLTALWQIYTGFSFDDLGHDDWKIKDTEDGKFIELYRGKTNSRCVIPFTQNASDTYEKLREIEGLRLFPIQEFRSNLNRKKINYDRYYRFLRAFAELSGIHFNSHTLRHTFGMQMSRKGIPMIDIAQMMGHSSTTTTEKFYVLPEDKQIIQKVLAIDT